ncbi:MAG: gamma-glutamylcyclotransferase [Casimicrobiaceae bacterium]
MSNRFVSVGVATGITREDIEANSAWEDFVRSPFARGRLMSDADIERSLEAMLARWNGREDVFVFGYGSLIWNPCLRHRGRYPALVHGWHRQFCLWSSVYRGTPERPGLVLALDRGGSVRGMVFRLAPEVVREELRLLWRREMTGGSYNARWLIARLDEPGEAADVQADGGRARCVPAVGFVINRKAPSYAGRLPDEVVVDRLISCAGRYGSGAEYLVQTDAALRAAGIVDPYLDRLCRRVAACHTEPSRPGMVCG